MKNIQHPLKVFSLFLLSTLIWSGCGTESPPPEPGRSITGQMFSTSVSVFRHFPERNAVEVPTDSVIQLEFTGGALSSSFELHNFYAVNAETGDVVPATLELNDDRTILSMIPELGLETSATYDVFSFGLLDEDGANISQFHSRFRTQNFGKGRGDFEVVDIKPSWALRPTQPIHIVFSRPISTQGNASELIAAWTDQIRVLVGTAVNMQGELGGEPVAVRVSLKCEIDNGCNTLEVRPASGSWVSSIGYGLNGMRIRVRSSDGSALGIQAADNKEGIRKEEATYRGLIPF